MSNANFPVRNSDGTFCVEIGLSLIGGRDEKLKPQIQEWISNYWVPRSAVWKREWKTGANLSTVDEQILKYEDEFDGPPEVFICRASELGIRMLGKASARFWRDWIVSKFLPDLKAAFPEVNDRLYIRDCLARRSSES